MNLNLYRNVSSKIIHFLCVKYKALTLQSDYKMPVEFTTFNYSTEDKQRTSTSTILCYKFHNVGTLAYGL